MISLAGKIDRQSREFACRIPTTEKSPEEMQCTGVTTQNKPPAIADEKVVEFIKVAQQHRARLLSAARRMTPPSIDAEDVVQDALLKAYRNLAQFRNESRIETWLYKITQNCARECLRRQKGRIGVSLDQARNEVDSPFDMDIPDPGKDPEECFLLQEMKELTVKEIKKLSALCQQAFKLCIFDELPQRTAAKRLRVQTVTVKARISRGRRMLKRAIQSNAPGNYPTKQVH
jgi:RNA polymerase sigma-70 factor, ECF subfamily